MSITTIASYPPVMTEFEVHWSQLNAARVANSEPEFQLGGGYGVTQFGADRSAIEQRLTVFEQLTNDQEFALNDRDSGREELRDRLINFRKMIAAYLPGSRYERALPETPGPSTTSGQMLKAMDDVADLWSRINADTGLTDVTLPLLLREGYDLATFNSELATLRERYTTLTTAERELKLAREDRDRELQAVYDRMKQYRERVPLDLSEDDPLVASLPQLTSQSGGGNGDAPDEAPTVDDDSPAKNEPGPGDDSPG
ncbi:MAG: hypothetical protein ACKVHE_03340 [Planctomycetales bacterium]|jgi:hypothetical protein